MVLDDHVHAEAEFLEEARRHVAIDLPQAIDAGKPSAEVPVPGVRQGRRAITVAPDGSESMRGLQGVHCLLSEVAHVVPALSR